MFGENVRIYDHDHIFSKGYISRDNFFLKPVFIGKNCWIGSDVIILKGVRIGDNCIISAGSIVTKDVPSGNIFLQKRESRFIEIT
ncbi:acyltransferase [Shewanella baltica]|uniref:acyltransferase n=1 Tax=Shewanella baltica TaxID=62322 RepID=UPI003D2EBCDB